MGRTYLRRPVAGLLRRVVAALGRVTVIIYQHIHLPSILYSRRRRERTLEEDDWGDIHHRGEVVDRSNPATTFCSNPAVTVST